MLKADNHLLLIFQMPIIALISSIVVIVFMEILQAGFFRLVVSLSDSADRIVIVVSLVTGLTNGLLFIRNIGDWGLPLWFYTVFITGGVSGLIFKIYLRERND